MTLSDIAAYAALLISVASTAAAWQAARHAKRQADLAHAALGQAQESSYSTAVISFINRFFDLVHDGMRFDDEEWANQYWRLQHTEFYYFDNGWLPQFIYEIWMIDLVGCYRSDPNALTSHEAHMSRYSVNNYELTQFFRAIQELACADFVDDFARYEAVRTYVRQYSV